MRRFTQSLLGQVMLSMAAALLIAQGISAVMLYRAASERRELAIMNAAAFQLLAGARIGDAEEQDIAFPGEGFWRRRQYGAGIAGVLQFIRRAPPDAEPVTGLQQIERHRHAHGAEADKPDPRAWFAVRHIRLP